MSRTDNSTRFNGLHNHGADGTQPLESGVLSQDFPKRLERLKEASGLSWRGFAKSLGVDPKQLRRWRKKGVEPSGDPCSPSSASQAASPEAWRPSWARASR